MLTSAPLTRDLVFIGGGHAHALVLRAWGMKRLPGARLTLINPGPTAPYTGMLPGHVAGHYARNDLEIDLVRLCRHAGARLILDKAVGLDRQTRQIHLHAHAPVAYDVASIDIGITAQMDIPGFAAHAVGAKPLDVFADRWDAFVDSVAAGRCPPCVAIIGGGVAGCELAMAMMHRLRGMRVAPTVTVIEAGPEISGVGPRARAHLRAKMSQMGITVERSAQVLRIGPEAVALADRPPVAAALCVGAAGAWPQQWLSATDLPLEHGFIEVGPDLGVRGDPHLFAVGDCAAMPHAPRPKAGVFAVRAAPVLRHNLRAALGVGQRRRWTPQRRYLKLVSLGGRSALAEKFGLTLSGPMLWRWKDRIDRAFMTRLSDLPQMENAPPKVAAAGVSRITSAAPVLCGGCGAKVGKGVLQGALSGVTPRKSGDLVAGAGDDAAVLRQPGGGYQVISTDHLRAFIEDPVQMTRIAAVHALGDIWAMGAQPQVALATVILPQMSSALQARTMDEITTVARAVLEAAGAELAGGHTTMGAELTIGFTITGTCAQMPITVGGAQPGDHLILTRPIGSGVLLAADMAGRGSGRDLVTALERMGQPQDREARVLRSHATAMTDVTGFGLAGHLGTLCAQSGLDATVWQEAVPVYAGARALSDQGIASSLMPDNKADTNVDGLEDPLLFDPQTAGGLLAAVPAGAAEAVLEALAGAGCEGWRIGVLQAGSGRITLRQNA